MGVVTQNASWNDTHAFVTVGRAVVRDVIPREGCALAQQAPVLFWFIVYTDDPSLDTADPRSRVRAALDVGYYE